jgi:hypothetical protein
MKRESLVMERGRPLPAAFGKYLNGPDGTVEREAISPE